MAVAAATGHGDAAGAVAVTAFWSYTLLDRTPGRHTAASSTCAERRGLGAAAALPVTDASGAGRRSWRPPPRSRGW
ncbi:MAG TPA: hypothetical protein VF069_19765 [Streptosporangiaceae bacterium]